MIGRAAEPRQGTVGQVALYVIMLIASLSYNFSFILIDYVRPFLVRTGVMSLEQTTLLYSFQGCGVILGSILVPPMVSRLGSKAVLLASSLALGACTALTLDAAAFPTWAASRLLIGVALAGSYVASMTLLANFFPAHVRGRLLAVNMSMFSVALLCAGGIGVATGGTDWHLFFDLAAVLPILVAVLILLLVPKEGGYAVYADSDEAVAEPTEGGKWRDMLVERRRLITASCVLLAGLNFCGYQFYSGFITTYLLSERHFDAAVVGWFVLIDGIGTLLGSALWGSVADRFGRRFVAIGFGTTTLFIALFLTVPTQKPLLLSIEFGYAFCLSATNCWAAHFAELFPVRLRPMGSALYHGGHAISLGAPWIVASIAHLHSLRAGMALAPMTFGAAALLWWSLPETLRTSRLYRGFDAERPLLKT